MNDNVLNEIGDILIIDVVPQMSGKITLTDYSDELEGLTENRSVKREFRVSQDSIFWNDWKELNSMNLVSEKYIVDNSFVIQVRYTRIGSDNTGTIEFKNINFMGSVEAIQFVAPTISSSIFANIIGTNEMKMLEENIFKKLYYRGIVPNYITRAQNSDEKEDKDYIDLFFSVARFYSMFISFFKRFENFRNDYDLMREQVRQYGIYFNESDITIEELQYLAQNLYDQIRQRGTEMIFKRKGYVLPNGEELKIDGEFIRLVRSKASDELLYENIPLDKVGWCMRQCSPMYRGTSMSKYLNKTRENTENFEDLSNFIITKRGNSSYELIDYDNKKVLYLKAKNGGIVGLGRQDDNLDVEDNVYVVDSSLDYEITFAFCIVKGVNQSSANIEFGVEGFDILKNKLNDAFITPNGFSISETFFSIQTTNKVPKIWYHVRGIIHAYSTSNVNNSPTNIGFGTNLYFNNSFVKYILPKIQINSTNEAEIAIWDYKIRPLVRGTNILPLKNGTLNSHSLGFIQSSRIFYSYVRNNNNSQSQNEITDIIEKYLLPFNVTDIFVFMNNYIKN